jgi:hypothetical protein
MKSLKLTVKVFFVQIAFVYLCFHARICPTKIHNKIMLNVFAVFHVEIESKSDFLILSTR